MRFKDMVFGEIMTNMVLIRANKLLLAWGIPIIMICAYLDCLIVGYHDFWGYLWLCAWEYTIYYFGVLTGVFMYHNYLRKNESQSNNHNQ